MTMPLSRQKLAAYYVQEYQAGRDALPRIAAYLVETRRTHEQTLLVRDIEAALAREGVVVATVSSVHELSSALTAQVTDFLKTQYQASDVALRTRQDASLLGGIKIETADATMDATAAHALQALKKTKA